MKKVGAVLAMFAMLVNISLAQTIGRYSLVNASAPILTRSIGAAGFSGEFLAAVGGVAFEKKASPAAGFAPLSILLQYVPQNADGMRVVVRIDGQPYRVNLYDWQLSPLVKFAQSDDHAVFTLFGQLTDRKEEELVLNGGGRVVNYHQAFTNSLMGLRMLQLDNLLASSENDDLAVELPMNGARYILGAGEHAPNVAGNRAAIARFQAALRAAGIVRFGRSYVVGDHEREIRFDVDGDTLRISGELGYYFWEYKGDRTARTLIRREMNLAKTAQGANFDERRWLIGQLSSVQRRLGEPLDAEQRSLLALLDPEEVQELLAESRAEELERQPEYKQVVPLTQLTQFVNSRISMVRSINPVVWDAGAAAMRYSAFFRYCRETDPASWERFADSVRNIAVRPQVSTPAVLQLTSDLRETASRSALWR